MANSPAHYPQLPSVTTFSPMGGVVASIAFFMYSIVQALLQFIMLTGITEQHVQTHFFLLIHLSAKPMHTCIYIYKITPTNFDAKNTLLYNISFFWQMLRLKAHHGPSHISN
jgi:hypothetical protein